MRTKAGLLAPDGDPNIKIIELSLSELDICYRYVKQFDIAIQAGGHIGIFPYAMSKTFGLIHSFEPSPVNFEFLDKNCQAPNIIKHHAALGDELKSIKINQNERNSGASYVDGKGEIPVMRIDDLDLPALDFLMLDVEGYEVFALRGACKTLLKFAPVICAEEKGLGGRFGINRDEIYELLESLGYKPAKKTNSDVIFVPR